MAEASRIASQYTFFHWPLEFPSIFHRERPGFDVVVGNPPWNKVKLELPGFLSLHDPGFRGIRSGIERDKRAAQLFEQRPELQQEIEEARRLVEVQRQFFSAENGYTIQGSGDTDLYKLFCERYAAITRRRGFIGVVLPRVSFLNDGSRGFRRWLFNECRPSRIDTLLNSGRWAFDMEPRYTIALTATQLGRPVDGALTITGPARDEEEFAKYIHSDGIEVSLNTVANWSLALTGNSTNELSWELPLLPTSLHVSVLNKLRGGVRFDALRNPEHFESASGQVTTPDVKPYRELDESKQRALFTHPPGHDRIPVWKGRSFDQYDPHGAELAGFADREDVLSFVQQKRKRSRIFKQMFSAEDLADPKTHPIYDCRVAFRDVSRSTDSRTVRACLIPPCTPITHTAPILVVNGYSKVSNGYLLGVMNSLPFDWLARRYVESHLTYFILNGLTFPISANADWQRIGTLAARISCVDERFSNFAAEVGVNCGPLSDAHRDEMRVEIDALVAKAYDLTEDELRFIFTDFTENAVSTAYRAQVLEKFASL